MSDNVPGFKFYCWSGAVRLTLLADSPLDAAKRLVNWAMGRNLTVEFADTISTSMMGFAASTVEFQLANVVAAMASEE